MLSQNIHRRHLLYRLDWVIILLYVVMVFVGWLAICGASYDFNPEHLFISSGRPMQQLLWVGLGIGLAFVVFFLNDDLFSSGAPYFYIGILVLLIVTAFVAPDIKGSRSWLVVGPIRIQPAEFAKMATALMLAYWLDLPEFKLDSLKSYLQIFLIILLPMGIIILQRETGSALVFCAFFLALYREGFSGIFLALASLGVILFIVALRLSGVLWGGTSASLYLICTIIAASTLLSLQRITRWRPRERQLLWLCLLAYTIGSILVIGWGTWDYSYVALGGWIALLLFILWRALFYYSRRYLMIAVMSFGLFAFSQSVEYVYSKVLAPHQQERIAVSLGIKEDLRGAGYNVNQAKIAIGSGGLLGKGFLQGTQTKLKYVPEQDTDFIFCTIGEEQGFLGSVAVLLLFLALILRLMWRAERQSSRFGRVYSYSLACILLFHVMVNVGMVIGIVPVIGIPLPLFSYGGSSMWGFTLMLAIFLKIDSRSRAQLAR